MLIAYLSPVIERPFFDTTVREVASAAVLKGASGWQRLAMAHRARGALRVLAPIVVRRDTLTNTAWETVVTQAIRIGEGDRFADLFTSTEALSSHPSRTRLADACAALGIDITGVLQLGPLVQRIWRAFEPAAHAEMYDRTTRLPHASITDLFDRADGSLGSGWEELEGSTWAVASNQARSTAGGTIRTTRRTEASFPDNQWAQAEVERTAGGFTGVGVRIAADGDSYLGFMDDTTVTLYDHTGGGGVSSLDSAAHASSAGVFQTMLVEVVGASITVDMEGVEVCSATDSAYASGKPGMASVNSNSDLDDFSCIDAVAPLRLLRPNSLRPRPFAPGIAR
jgi:hypothetical protein